MTLPEILLWQELRSGKLGGLRFRRQHPVGSYILDFYCSAVHLAIEIDGRVHEGREQMEYDRRRDYWLAGQAIKVLRISASDVLKKDNMENMLACILRAAAPSTASRSPSPVNGGGTSFRSLSLVVATLYARP
jgi:very-short-patch-repair endonuclease